MQAWQPARRRFLANQCGNVVLTFTILSPAVILSVGAAVDFSYLSLQKSNLQQAVDAAAIAAVRELRLANTSRSNILAVAKNSVVANLNGKPGNVSVNAVTSSDPLTVTVSATQTVKLNFMNKFYDGQISANAVAEIVGGSPICLLGLDEAVAKPAITLQRSARITGNGCAIYSNATGSKSLVSYDSALMRADFICTSGGYTGAVSNYQPRPMTDCPNVPDPLISRAAPPIGNCTESFKRIDMGIKFKADFSTISRAIKRETLSESGKNTSNALTNTTSHSLLPRSSFTASHVTLKPGVYCGGLAIGGAAEVTLEPGIYVIKNGPLFVNDYASLKGQHVGFYFTGTGSTLYFGPHTSISLTAPTSGEMAGLLFFENRNQTKLLPYAILSDDARVLEGTIYFPRNRLFVDADSPIADQSAYTAIVARRVDLFAGPHLVLNTNYDQTDVPVPDGIARNGKIILKE
ncbi:MAG: hypothetical protein C0605_10230 [Hyphomicrobiales bacterium]|nr:MAG: hypothetical protein C0605_10230 [Hyphomicrobiales bacterium]